MAQFLTNVLIVNLVYSKNVCLSCRNTLYKAITESIVASIFVKSTKVLSLNPNGYERKFEIRREHSLNPFVMKIRPDTLRRVYAVGTKFKITQS